MRFAASLAGLIFAVVACGAPPAHGTTPAAAQVVPWADRTASPWSPPAPPTPTPYPTVGPPCQASQLRVADVRGGAAAGNESTTVTLVNAGSSCMLGGRPGVFVTDNSGTRLELHPSPHTFFGPLVPGDLAPGAPGYLVFGTSGMCATGSGAAYTNLSLEMPGGGTLDTGKPLGVGNCGLGMSDLGLRPPQPAPTSPPSPGTVGTLQVSIAVPDTVRRGDRLQFTATLTNPGSEPVALEPCPSYTMTIGYPDNLPLTYWLNCSGVKSIAPGSAVTYQMQITVPAGATPGPTKFSWRLNAVGDRTGAGASFSVTT